MNDAVIFSSLETADDSPPQSASSQAQRIERLGAKELSALSDTDLNDYIHGCAEQFLAAQRRWDAHGDFADIGERDAWWHAEAEALRERGSRPEVVRQMEAERGLSGR